MEAAEDAGGLVAEGKPIYAAIPTTAINCTIYITDRADEYRVGEEDNAVWVPDKVWVMARNHFAERLSMNYGEEDATE